MKKNILITGATGGLGKSVVEKFRKLGYAISITASPGKSAERVEDGVRVIEADLTDEKKVSVAIGQWLSEGESVDAAVLLVGAYAGGGIDETDGALLRKMYTLNFETAWNVVRPIFTQMITQSTGGRIVLVGARPAIQVKDAKKAVAYSLSKSLLFRLAEILNEEGKSKSVITSVIVPSTIDTPSNRKSMPAADFDQWVKPDQIADVIVACSDSDNVLREPVLKVYGNA